MTSVRAITLTAFLLMNVGRLAAQSLAAPAIDIAAAYLAEHSLQAPTTNRFWMQGGSLSLGLNLRHGFGPAADVSVVHTGSIGTSGIPLTLQAITFGPRYRWHAQSRLSAYAQAMFGVATGSDSLFPASPGTVPSSSSLALQFGGGLDYGLCRHLELRPVDLAYLRTSLLNGTSNTQNTFRAGTALVLRF